MVKAYLEKVTIPTFEIGKEEKNPMFYEKRVYQGSSGKVYPLPIIDKITDEKVNKEYNGVYLENEYIKILVLPELGGRIQRAIDKTNNYDFIYYNKSIKPQLVGLTGPWISGGIEFNWPQHHRPSTFLPIEYKIENTEEKASVILSEIDKMYGTKQTLTISLYEGKSYIELNGKLFNRTDLNQTFLWWANPAVEVNDFTQSIFPPDVTAVYDHGKRDVSSFPIATGTYYKIDYSKGVDISRYKNIPVPTSYMAYKSKYDFIGGYDYSVDAGVLHIANHHISPGKKQWTWGNGDFGKTWDKCLSEDKRPYIELMTGVYTDNQPDFTWLAPYEEKEFTQYFMPYKGLGEIKNANKDFAFNVEFRNSKAIIKLYSSSLNKNLKLMLHKNSNVLSETSIDSIDPYKILNFEFNLDEKDVDDSLTLSLLDSQGNIVLSYRNEEVKKEVPSPASAPSSPKNVLTNEELYYIGTHLEQYRHATYRPEDYYLEGLKRDKYDVRINTAYGLLLLRRGCFLKSIEYFDNAIKRLTSRNERPFDAECFLYKAIALKHLNRYSEAYDLFYKATWSYNEQSQAYYNIALLDVLTAKENKEFSYRLALDHVNRSLDRNRRNRNALFLYCYINYLLNASDINEKIDSILKDDPMNYALIYLKNKVSNNTNDNLYTLLRGDSFNYLELSNDLFTVGDNSSAIEVLIHYIENYKEKLPLVYYTLSYYYFNLNDKDNFNKYASLGESSDPYLTFPNTLSNLKVLKCVIDNFKTPSKANYYLGCMLYDKFRFDDAKECYQKSIELDDSFPTVHRNLGILYFNKDSNKEEALLEFKKAFSLDKKDARVLYEYDQVRKRCHFGIKDRLNLLEEYKDLLDTRDDLYLEYIVLLNQNQMFEKSLEMLSNHTFHVWEGGEGNIAKEYVKANIEIARLYIDKKEYDNAIKQLNYCYEYPINLGEGKLEGTVENHINYYMGIAYKLKGDLLKSKEYFNLASKSLKEVSSQMYYNDQPSDSIFFSGLALMELEKFDEAYSKFDMLKEYAVKHTDDNCSIDYFAVSLPSYLIFDNDLNYENKSYCIYLEALSDLGKGNNKKAKELFQEVLARSPEYNGLFNLRKM